VEAANRQEATMTGSDIVEKLAELQKHYADAHRPVRPIDAYRKRHARRHRDTDYDGEIHLSQYRPRH
jgi:hypothetical protein